MSPTPHSSRARGLLRRWLVVLVGIPVLVLGVALTIASDMGPGSWQILEVALADLFGVSIGLVIVLESLAALAVSWLWLGQRPGPATLILGVGGGLFIDWSLGWLPVPDTTTGSLAMVVAGSVLIAIGVGLYVPAELGPSAQDSLFVGLYRRFDVRPGTAKFGTDFVIAATGWLLGGPIGLGTVIVTVAVPPLVNVVLPVGHRLAGTDAATSTTTGPVTATTF